MRLWRREEIESVPRNTRTTRNEDIERKTNDDLSLRVVDVVFLSTQAFLRLSFVSFVCFVGILLN